MDWTVGVGLASVILGPIGAYFIASRRLSGKISTSEASDLWEESSKIREDYRQRLLAANERTQKLESRVADVEGENNALTRENIKLQRTISQLELTIESLQHRLARYEENSG